MSTKAAVGNRLLAAREEGLKDGCGQYDWMQLMLPGDAIGPVPLITATKTLEDTLHLVKILKQPRHVLLFTAAGMNGKQLFDFEAFVRLNAVI